MTQIWSEVSPINWPTSDGRPPLDQAVQVVDTSLSTNILIIVIVGSVALFSFILAALFISYKIYRVRVSTRTSRTWLIPIHALFFHTQTGSKQLSIRSHDSSLNDLDYTNNNNASTATTGIELSTSTANDGDDTNDRHQRWRRKNVAHTWNSKQGSSITPSGGRNQQTTTSVVSAADNVTTVTTSAATLVNILSITYNGKLVLLKSLASKHIEIDRALDRYMNQLRAMHHSNLLALYGLCTEPNKCCFSVGVCTW